MNNLKYHINFDFFNERLIQMVEKIKAEYERGNIRTLTEYSMKINKEINDFYDNLGSPLFKGDDTVVVPDYNLYLKKIDDFRNDIINLNKFSEYINELSKENKIESDDNINIIKNRISSIQTGISDIEEYLSNNINNNKKIVFIDSFEKQENNTCATSEKALIDKTNKLLSLYDKNNINLTPNLSVEILNSSTGFPGNTHECYKSSNGVKFIGESNLFLFPNDLISQTKDTFFEFELYSIDDKVKEETNEVGFKYKENIQWVDDDNKILKLNLKINLDTPSKANFFKIDGVPAGALKTKLPIIRSFLVSDGDSTIQKRIVNLELKEDTVISFNSQVVSFIILEIEQQHSYSTNVCRECNVNIDSTSTAFNLIENNINNNLLVETDNLSHSIFDIGMGYDTKNKKIEYKVNSLFNSSIDIENIKRKLFYRNFNTKDTQHKRDIVPANRKLIKINRLFLKYSEFEKRGVYISKEFKVDKTIKRITLTTDDYIPEQYNLSNKDYIEYYISVDSGNTWTRIHPRHRACDGPCTLEINSQIETELRNKNVIYLDTLLEAKTAKLKIVLTRDEEVKDMSPLVFQYKLELDIE